MWMVRCYSGETYSNGGRRNRITRKIHPLDSVRLTLNCEAGTLSLDVNGIDQGVIFSNVPPDVHPAVCFYGVAKSVRLVELKRIYGDSDSDASDSEGESDAESTAAQSEGTGQTGLPLEGVLAPTTMASGEDPAKPSEVGASASPSQASPSRSGEGACIDPVKESQEPPGGSSKRRVGRREDEAIASTIHAAAADTPSSGLLASLANFAQWYVPRGQEGEQNGATDQRSELDEVAGNRATRAVDSGPPAPRAGGVFPGTDKVSCFIFASCRYPRCWPTLTELSNDKKVVHSWSATVLLLPTCHFSSACGRRRGLEHWCQKGVA